MWISGNSRCCIPKTPVGNLLWLFKARFWKEFCSHIGSIIWTLWIWAWVACNTSMSLPSTKCTYLLTVQGLAVRTIVWRWNMSPTFGNRAIDRHNLYNHVPILPPPQYEWINTPRGSWCNTPRGSLWPIYGQLITSGHQEPRGVFIHSYWGGGKIGTWL
jgi:hypothetical protein